MNSKMLRDLTHTLCLLYPDVASIRRIADYGELEQSRIDFATSAINIWHAVLAEAEKVERISALLDVVDTEYGTNKGFRKAYDMYHLSADQINPALNDAADHNIFMNTVLQSAVVKVTGTRLGAFGTGFAIRRDHQHLYIVTCYHVILEVGGEKTLFIRQIPAELVDYDPEDGFNLALLRVRAEAVANVPVLPLARNFGTQQRFHVAGHYRFDKQMPVKTVTGRFLREDTLRSDHRNCQSHSWHIQINSPDEILESSLSGGPVVNEVGEVIAVISCKAGKGKTGFAVSIEAVAQLQADLNRSDKHQQKPHNKPIQLRQRDGLYLMNFETELYEFERLIREPNPTVKLIVVQGPTGSGKSELLTDYYNMILEQRGQESNQFDLAEYREIEQYLDDIVNQLGVHLFANYRAFQRKGKPDPLTRSKEQEWEDNLTREFFQDLTLLGTPNAFFVFFDRYEKTERDPTFRRWFTKTFLPRLNQNPLVVIIAGEDVPEPLLSWKTKHHFRLQGVSIDWYQRYAEAHGIAMEPNSLEMLHANNQGRPEPFVNYINIIKGKPIPLGASA